MTIHTNTIIKQFNELSPCELYDILQARSQVFVVEQTCPYQDVDGLDSVCHHLLCYYDDETLNAVEHLVSTPRLIAYCRIIPPMTNSQNETSLPAIGRVLVMPKSRGQGLARALMHSAIDFCHATYPKQSIIISAQTYLVAFYKSLGFKTVGEAYDEDGIEHIDMVLKS